MHTRWSTEGQKFPETHRQSSSMAKQTHSITHDGDAAVDAPTGASGRVPQALRQHYRFTVGEQAFSTQIVLPREEAILPFGVA